MIYVWLGAAFVLGAVVGSGLNVCISRIPLEKSILWPSSRCDRCLSPIRWHDNVPLLSYWILGGKCRNCRQSYSMRHFWVEALTGCAFAGVFYLTVMRNVLDVPVTRFEQFEMRHGLIPFRFWALWGAHCVLVGFLIVASMCDVEHFEIPLPVTVTGMIVGLVLGMACPWPWPATAAAAHAVERIQTFTQVPMMGLQLWPFWHPLPSWLPYGSWKLGLANSLAGILVGTMLLRAIRFLFAVGRGKEGLGVGDADLMMMAGAFLGWQAIVIAFFVSVFPALLLGIVQVLMRRDQMIPFGPSLSLGLLVTAFGWKRISPPFEPAFFDFNLLVIISFVGALMFLVVSLLLRLGGGTPVAKEN